MILPRTGGLYTQQKKKVRRLKPKRRTEARRSPSSLQSMRHGLFREQCCLSDRESLLIQIDTRNTLSQYAQQLIRDGVHDFSASFDGLIVGAVATVKDGYIAFHFTSGASVTSTMHISIQIRPTIGSFLPLMSTVSLLEKPRQKPSP